MNKKVLFLHHSTGGNLILQGKVRQLLAQKTPQVEFWDHGYNLYKGFPLFLIKPFANRLTFHTGLSNPNGEMTGIDYDIRLGNDDPQDFTIIFNSDPDNKTLQQILKYDVIAFKNCFPTTKIETNEKLERFKKSFRDMRLDFDKHRNKLFIPFTPPPLRREVTRPEYARRAQKLARWLVSSEFHSNRKNIKVFDFFKLLADEDGYLKKEYCSIIPIDSHPNRKANEKIGLIFVDFLVSNMMY